MIERQDPSLTGLAIRSLTRHSMDLLSQLKSRGPITGARPGASLPVPDAPVAVSGIVNWSSIATKCRKPGTLGSGTHISRVFVDVSHSHSPSWLAARGARNASSLQQRPFGRGLPKLLSSHSKSTFTVCGTQLGWIFTFPPWSTTITSPLTVQPFTSSFGPTPSSSLTSPLCLSQLGPPPVWASVLTSQCVEPAACRLKPARKGCVFVFHWALSEAMATLRSILTDDAEIASFAAEPAPRHLTRA